jgi:hypothetical protein
LVPDCCHPEDALGFYLKSSINHNILLQATAATNSSLGIRAATFEREKVCVGLLAFIVVSFGFAAAFATGARNGRAATLYGIDIITDQLITIDTVTGAGTAVGSVGFANVGGLAFQPAVVPVPSALMLFGSGLIAMFSWIGIGRRRQWASNSPQPSLVSRK